MRKNDEIHAKVVFVGLEESGKTLFRLRLTQASEKLPDEYQPTIGTHYVTQDTTDQKIIFEIWDTGGRERYKALITEMYLKKSTITILFIDLTRVKESIEYFKRTIKGSIFETTKCIVVFTKSDSDKAEKFTTEQFKEHADVALSAAGVNQEQIPNKNYYFVTSAKNHTNVTNVFESWVNLVSTQEIIVPALILPPLQKKSQGLWDFSWHNSSQSSEEEPEPLVTTFTF